MAKQPTNHSARSADKSPLVISGEVKLNLQFGDISLPVSALVMDKLDCDILAGVPFCKENDITVHLKDEKLAIHSIKIKYGQKSASICHEIYRSESFLIRNVKVKALLPGDYMEFESEDLKGYNGEIAIEPHNHAKKKTWPNHVLSRVIQGRIRIANSSEEVVLLSKSEHVAKIRRVTIPKYTTPANMALSTIPDLDNSNNIIIDPDNQLAETDLTAFQNLHSRFANVFSSKFGGYNDSSGRVRANVSIGKVAPPPRKGQLPYYNQSNLQLLQEEADKLEALGVLARPEDVNVNVKYVSPSFLTKKPSGGHRFVTDFNGLSEYVRLPPSIATPCNDVLRRISSWEFLIQCDLTKSFFQIPVTK